MGLYKTRLDVGGDRHMYSGVADLRRIFGMKPLKWRSCSTCGADTLNYYRCSSCWASFGSDIAPELEAYGISYSDIKRLQQDKAGD